MDLGRFRVEPGSTYTFADEDAADTSGVGGKTEGEAEVAVLRERISDLQEKLHAEGRRSLLVVLQGMDASGKDGAVKHVLGGVNPAGVNVHSFKAPTADELAHDFLWRCHKVAPAAGMIGVWNRSHYEDVLVVRVRELVGEEVWRPRYEAINAFERTLTEAGTTIVKLFVAISREEQYDQLSQRLEDPSKFFKWNDGDLAERERWEEYRTAYEGAISATSTEWAPWYVAPADKRWYRNYVVAQVLAGTLEAMDPQFPTGSEEEKAAALKALKASRT